MAMPIFQAQSAGTTCQHAGTTCIISTCDSQHAFTTCIHNMHYINMHSQRAFTTCIISTCIHMIISTCNHNTHYINVHLQHASYQLACTMYMHTTHSVGKWG